MHDDISVSMVNKIVTNDVITLGALSGAAFIFFVVLLIIGIAKKHKVLLLTATALFYLSIGLGIGSTYVLIKNLTEKIDQGKTEIRDDQIYSALFGTPLADCAVCLYAHSEIAKPSDNTIYLHMVICPAELTRLLKRGKYSGIKTATPAIEYTLLDANDEWYKYGDLGDSTLVFTSAGKKRNLYCSTDSTEFYCIDRAN